MNNMKYQLPANLFYGHICKVFYRFRDNLDIIESEENIDINEDSLIDKRDIA